MALDSADMHKFYQSVSAQAAAEPRLPIEKKLIGWSLGTGVGLLIILLVLNHFVPITV